MKNRKKTFDSDFPPLTAISTLNEAVKALEKAFQVNSPLSGKQRLCLTLPESLSHGAIGPVIFREIVLLAQKSLGNLDSPEQIIAAEQIIALYPCGNRAGDVLLALKVGIKHISYEGPAFEKLENLATGEQACLYPHAEWIERVAKAEKG